MMQRYIFYFELTNVFETFFFKRRLEVILSSLPKINENKIN